MHPRPKGDGRQSVSRDRRRRDRGAAQGLRNSLLAAPALQQRWPRPPPPPSSSAGGGPLPTSRLGLRLFLSADGLRAVRFSCVTSSCSSSRSGGFTFHWSPPLSPLRACSLCCGLPLAPGAQRSAGRRSSRLPRGL